MDVVLRVCSGQGNFLESVIMQVGIETLQMSVLLAILLPFAQTGPPGKATESDRDKCT